ncbi:MAG: HesA/MoeB/ThiF family protein [Firmicutes bacterium]|nr:HesA/MoeB/ThiF family protein [Bacillota bacterium]
MCPDDKRKELYNRQIIMKEIGEEGQQKLAKASVLVVGCGGLGAPALYYLAAMGIGHLGLCDGDVVSISNLNRQLLYTMDDIGKPKVTAAHKRLLALNPYLETTLYEKFLSKNLAESILPNYDIALDCLDNFAGRFVLNDACVTLGIPFVHAGVGGFGGQLLTVTPGISPCLRCLFPQGEYKKEPSQPEGVIGATPGVLGSMQALEVLKYLLGLPLSNDGFVVYDGISMSFDKVKLMASPQCFCQKSNNQLLQ